VGAARTTAKKIIEAMQGEIELFSILNRETAKNIPLTTILGPL
jgi:hypothetical protein